MSDFLDNLPTKYRTILCDLWGVVHDGVKLFPGAADRLVAWAGEGRTIILLTNAPRTKQAVAEQIDGLGLPREAWHGIATSGEAGIAGLKALDEPVGFIGTPADRANLEGREIVIAERDDFDHIACSGIDGKRREVEEYRDEIAPLAERNVTMHCLNPDRVVHRGGVPEPCAGAIADLYEALGGTVEWYGKPYPAIYRHAFALAGNPEKNQVLAIGDSLGNDMLGAARQGVDAVFVQGGIHAGDPFPADFASQYGLGEWAPVAVIPSLG